jgi:hypothetical protein
MTFMTLMGSGACIAAVEHIEGLQAFGLRFLRQRADSIPPIGVANRGRAAGIGVAVGGATIEKVVQLGPNQRD